MKGTVPVRICRSGDAGDGRSAVLVAGVLVRGMLIYPVRAEAQLRPSPAPRPLTGPGAATD